MNLILKIKRKSKQYVKLGLWWRLSFQRDFSRRNCTTWWWLYWITLFCAICVEFKTWCSVLSNKKAKVLRCKVWCSFWNIRPLGTGEGKEQNYARVIGRSPTQQLG